MDLRGFLVKKGEKRVKDSHEGSAAAVVLDAYMYTNMYMSIECCEALGKVDSHGK